MIDYKKLKQIFPNGLPEAHIFFAHREVSDVLRISYATLRRETGYRSTNRGAWVRFVKKFNEETADVPVDSIALTLPSSVDVGAKIAGLINILPADVTIGEEVELAISDVTVASGLILSYPTTGKPNGALEVTGKKAGTVTIKIICQGKESNTITVTVKNPVVAVTGVTMAPKTASVDVGSTVKLTGTVAPANATNKSVTYKSSDATIATVAADGTVTGVKAGSATITVTTADGNKTDTCVVTVNAGV
ncbi:Ig-like protein [Serratia phage Slocum]|nr:Ig-like protein [Serratia phage Slocum]